MQDNFALESGYSNPQRTLARPSFRNAILHSMYPCLRTYVWQHVCMTVLPAPAGCTIPLSMCCTSDLCAKMHELPRRWSRDTMDAETKVLQERTPYLRVMKFSTIIYGGCIHKGSEGQYLQGPFECLTGSITLSILFV